MRLLLIDDHQMTNTALTAVLEPYGYAVSGCRELEEAKTLHLEQPFDAVLLDATRQGSHGIDFCTWVRTQPAGERVAIVVSMATFDPGTVAAYLSGGAGDVLCCPLDARTIQADIETAIFQRA